jgi:hypothetical protein
MLSAEIRVLPWNPTSIPINIIAATIHAENFLFIERPLFVEQHFLFFQRLTGDAGSSLEILHHLKIAIIDERKILIRGEGDWHQKRIPGSRPGILNMIDSGLG